MEERCADQEVQVSGAERLQGDVHQHVQGQSCTLPRKERKGLRHLRSGVVYGGQVCKTLPPLGMLPTFTNMHRSMILQHNQCRSVTHQVNCVTCRQAVLAACNESMLMFHRLLASCLP